MDRWTPPLGTGEPHAGDPQADRSAGRGRTRLLVVVAVLATLALGTVAPTVVGWVAGVAAEQPFWLAVGLGLPAQLCLTLLSVALTRGADRAPREHPFLLGGAVASGVLAFVAVSTLIRRRRRHGLVRRGVRRGLDTWFLADLADAYGESVSRAVLWGAGSLVVLTLVALVWLVLVEPLARRRPSLRDPAERVLPAVTAAVLVVGALLLT